MHLKTSSLQCFHTCKAHAQQLIKKHNQAPIVMQLTRPLRGKYIYKFIHWSPAIWSNMVDLIEMTTTCTS